MGCVSSKGDINDRHPNVFHVWNVDDMGNVLVPGRIEITETELVLHQRGGAPAVRWPMRCLRRYGFETELFSFESGRRCATGAGIYAFRCRRAEALFNLLQEYIQCCGQEDGTGLAGAHGAAAGHLNLGHGNGMAMAAAAAANGSMLRPNSVPLATGAAQSAVGPDANYLEPIVRHRTRSATSREGLAQIATLSLPNNLAQAGGLNGDAGFDETQHGYMNDSAIGSALAGACEPERGSVDGSSAQRSPLTPPANAPWLHEYANTTPIDMEGETVAMVAKCTTNGVAANGCVISNGVAVDVNGEVAPHESKRTALYSLLDLRRRHRNTPLKVSGNSVAAAAVAATANVAGSGIGCPGTQTATGRRQMVLLRGHSLDDDGTSNYARLDDLLRQEVQQEQALKRHLYMNVVPDSNAAKRRDKAVSMVVGSGYREHFYANIAPSAAPVTSPAETDESRVALVDSQPNGPTRNHRHSNSLGGIAGLVQQRSAAVNYAVLDLNHRGSSSSGGSGSISGGAGTSGATNGAASGASSDTAPTSPTGSAAPTVTEVAVASVMATLAVANAGGRETALAGYATIDFDKTAALSNTVNPDAGGGMVGEDEAVRRTRHDANINDVMPQLLMLGRQSTHGGSVAGD